MYLKKKGRRKKLCCEIGEKEEKVGRGEKCSERRWGYEANILFDIDNAINMEN